MHRRGTGQAFNRLVQRIDPPLFDIVHKNIEGRLIKLNQIDTRSYQFAGLGIQNIRKGHGHFRAAAVMLIRNGIADCHGAGQGELQHTIGVCAGEADFLEVYGLRS